MTDELEGLDAKLLRGMLPALYRKAQEGDQRSIDTVLRILQRLEKNAPTPTLNEPAEPGFTRLHAVASAPTAVERGR